MKGTEGDRKFRRYKGRYGRRRKRREKWREMDRTGEKGECRAKSRKRD